MILWFRFWILPERSLRHPLDKSNGCSGNEIGVRAEIKNLLCEHASNAKTWEHEQASTRLNFASKGKILRAVKNFNGPFITPYDSVAGEN